MTFVKSMSLPTLYEHYTRGGIESGLSANQPFFTLNNRNITIFSGAMHYFRVPPEYWRDRLRKIRAAGLNAVETYVPWNLHEPQADRFDFGSGGSDFEKFLDIELFLKMAQEEDLFAIVRPGPYICAEWEFGGMPSWLLRNREMRLRSSDATFMFYVEKYFRTLLSILTVLQFTNGGPIIAFQIENEFGSLKMHDTRYLKGLKRIFRGYGIVELLFTSDGPSAGNLGQIPDTLFTGNFQSDPRQELRILQSYQPGKPLMVMEYWTGWFDHWGEPHNAIPDYDFVYTLGIILRFPASVNLYMFHGGTSFGFMNGANYFNRELGNAAFQPDTNSYDYDAPLSESGDYTQKYFSAKNLIRIYNKIRTRIPPMPKLKRKVAYETIEIQHQLTLLEMLEQIPYRIYAATVIPMEALPINNNSGQSYGYIVYRKENIYIPPNSVLTIVGGVCDTVMVLIDGALKSKILESVKDFNGFGYWRLRDSELEINSEYLNATLDLVVENWGRVNFGAHHQFFQYKGLWQGPILLNNESVDNWVIIPLEFKTRWIKKLTNWHPLTSSIYRGPALYKTKLYLEDKPEDTYVDMRDWNKGIVIVNGFVLSRYCTLGPQQMLYLPAPFLKRGFNDILVFEHFDAFEYIKFSNKQIYQTMENKHDIFTKRISIYIED